MLYFVVVLQQNVQDRVKAPNVVFRDVKTWKIIIILILHKLSLHAKSCVAILTVLKSVASEQAILEARNHQRSF